MSDHVKFPIYTLATSVTAFSKSAIPVQAKLGQNCGYQRGLGQSLPAKIEEK
jgi:hypothetical protein